MSGLSAGIFSRMSGFDTKILEMHSIPGGLCTAWNRKGYTFDLCIHWLTSSRPGSARYRLYEEVGLIQGLELVTPEYWKKVKEEQGNELTMYYELDKLKSELLRLSREDSTFISGFCNDIKKIRKMQVPVDLTLLDKIKFIPIISVLKKYQVDNLSVVSQVQNPVLRKLLSAGLDWEGQSVFFTLMGFALQGAGNAGYPIGGSLPLAKSMEKRFLELGGSIQYKSKVESITTDNNRATGVRLSDGTLLSADCVISCADGHSTIFDWLRGEYCDDTIKGYYKNLKPFPPIIFVSLGLNRSLADIPKNLTVIFNNPVMIGGTEQKTITFRNHSNDPTLYPEGKGIITTWLPVNYEWWDQLDYQGELYKVEKEKALQQVINLLLNEFPDLSGTIEVTDVATPMTFVRYTGNWKGSYEGWLVTPGSFFFELPLKLPGLTRFYMAGQWTTTGGGIPGSIKSGRSAVKSMCKELNQPFKGKN